MLALRRVCKKAPWGVVPKPLGKTGASPKKGTQKGVPKILTPPLTGFNPARGIIG